MYKPISFNFPFSESTDTTDGDSLSPRDISHLCMLAHLALLLQRVIADINAHLPRTFKLRIGRFAFGCVCLLADLRPVSATGVE